MTSKKPVLTSDLLKTKIAPMIITALLLNPLRVSSMVRTSVNNNIPVVDNAVTSRGSHSLKNAIIEVSQKLLKNRGLRNKIFTIFYEI